MRKRLRKKLYKGEFQELGFFLYAVLQEKYAWKSSYIKQECSPFDMWHDNFLALVESLGLCVGGGAGDTLDYYVTSYDRNRKVTTEDADILVKFLLDNGYATSCGVSDLSDSRYMSDKEFNFYSDQAKSRALKNGDKSDA